MLHCCSCEWCTTPTSLKQNYAITLPCIIRFGQAKSEEKTAIACMYKIIGEDVFVLFSDGTRFSNLTSAGKYAHSVLLQKKTSPSHNGWKRWRVNLRFPDKTIKPVVLKTLKDAKIAFENTTFDETQMNLKSKFCYTCGEKITNKTILNILINQPMSLNKRKLEDVVLQLNKKYKKMTEKTSAEQDNSDECEEYNDDGIDLNSLVADTSKMPGNRDYNQVVYGRKYIQFSNIRTDEEDDRFFTCTLTESFHNLKIPKCVLMALAQYQTCQELKEFRDG